MNKLILLLCLLSCALVNAQDKVYTTANAHSHNDYEKAVPFYDAYKHQFGSIEADIFLLDGSMDLYVAHHKSDLDKKRRTLDSLYLSPLANCIRKNKGFVYTDTSRKLQLMIDIKTGAVPTLNRLIEQLRRYPELINSSSLRIVISGNRPAADSFYLYPSFIWFDGVIGTKYHENSMTRIAMLSAPFTQFSHWNGIKTIPEKQRIELANAIAQAHKAGKPVRFWGGPDTVDAWKEFINLRVDYINTDHVRELSEFLKSLH